MKRYQLSDIYILPDGGMKFYIEDLGTNLVKYYSSDDYDKLLYKWKFFKALIEKGFTAT